MIAQSCKRSARCLLALAAIILSDGHAANADHFVQTFVDESNTINALYRTAINTYVPTSKTGILYRANGATWLAEGDVYSWTKTQVPHVGAFGSLAYDDVGEPQTAWQDGAGVHWASRGFSNWLPEFVSDGDDALVASPVTVYDPSVERPWVAYVTDIPGIGYKFVRVRRREAPSQWTTLNVDADPNGDVFPGLSMHIRSNGVILIAYIFDRFAGPPVLRIATLDLDAGLFVPNDVWGVCCTSNLFFDLKEDAFFGDVAIAFTEFRSPYSVLQYAARINDQWSMAQVVDSTLGFFRDVDLEPGPNFAQHITYTEDNWDGEGHNRIKCAVGPIPSLLRRTFNIDVVVSQAELPDVLLAGSAQTSYPDGSPRVSYLASNQAATDGDLMLALPAATVNVPAPTMRAEALRIWPNPIIQGEAVSCSWDRSAGGLRSMKMFDLRGRVVQERNGVAGENPYLVKTRELGLSPGLYVVDVVTDQGVKLRGKVIIMR